MELVAQKQAQGYDAIGLDNYDPMNNHYGACGVWRNDSAGHRKWVQLYSGKVSGDHKFTQAAVDWLGRLKARVNALKSKRGNAMVRPPLANDASCWARLLTPIAPDDSPELLARRPEVERFHRAPDR